MMFATDWKDTYLAYLSYLPMKQLHVYWLWSYYKQWTGDWLGLDPKHLQETLIPPPSANWAFKRWHRTSCRTYLKCCFFIYFLLIYVIHPLIRTVRHVTEFTTLLKIKVLHDAIEEPFLSKWFHKEPLTSEEPFCFTKGSLWRKKVLQIIKR